MSQAASPYHAALKTLTAALIERAGGLEAASTVARVGVTSLSNYQNPNTAQFMPIDVVLQLERLSGVGPMVSRFLVTAQGYSLGPAAEVAGARLDNQVAGLWREIAEFQSRYADAVADGRVDGGEMAVLAKEAEDIAEQAHGVVAVAARHAAPGEG